MKLEQIYEILNNLAPLSLSKEMCLAENGYDNSGVICHVERSITGVVFALDLTKKVVEFAVENGADLIVTHHPAIYAPIKKVDGALKSAVQNGLGVISMHLNVDVAKCGIDFFMADALGAKNAKVLLELPSGGGYGRLFSSDLTVGQLAEKAKTAFGSDKVSCYGNSSQKAGTVASFCGAGLGDDCASITANVLVSSDVKHHQILACLESGKSLILPTHYAVENYGFNKFFEVFASQNGLQGVKLYYYNDDRLL